MIKYTYLNCQIINKIVHTYDNLKEIDRNWIINITIFQNTFKSWELLHSFKYSIVNLNREFINIGGPINKEWLTMKQFWTKILKILC